MFSQKHLLGTDEDETVKMSGDIIIFTQKSFSEMKEALQIIEQKDTGHLGTDEDGVWREGVENKNFL